MSRPSRLHPADLHGLLRLAADATVSVTDIVEAMHAELAFPSVLTSPRPSGTRFGLPALAYSAVRSVAWVAGQGIDLAMPRLATLAGPPEPEPGPTRDALVSVLNGVVGDHLADTGNPLAIAMHLRRCGAPLTLRRESLSGRIDAPSGRVAVLIHGLCGHEAQWSRSETSYAAGLERDFGYAVLHLRYNSGLHVSSNGEALASLLEELVREWPVDLDELLLVGHSMGGLVARSAAHSACERGLEWKARLRRMAFLGSPHHGAPLERGGQWFEQLVASAPFASPLARLGRLRSAGITDLRHGSVAKEDWQGRDRFEPTGDRRRAVPLPDGVDCLAVAATAGSRPGDARDRLLVGDGLVPVVSALGRHRDPDHDLGFSESRAVVVPRASHMALLGEPRVWETLSNWLSA
jgi:pimeloyl-ACP methyl ester carboxylesterase